MGFAECDFMEAWSTEWKESAHNDQVEGSLHFRQPLKQGAGVFGSAGFSVESISFEHRVYNPGREV